MDYLMMLYTQSNDSHTETTICYQVIKVREARQWQTRLATPVRQQEYDWTWGTDYAGSCFRKAAGDDEYKEVRSARVMCEPAPICRSCGER